MPAKVAWRELSRADEKLKVLDPMSGSGTSLIVAATLGHRAVGVDIDPLAVLMARVWTTEVDAERLKAAGRRILARARQRRRVPLPMDRETRDFIRYWFDETNREQLAALADAISGVRDHRIRDALWCAFSRMIITKQGGVSLAMDLAHSRPHRVRDVASVEAYEVFLGKVDELAKLLPASITGSARVTLGDARRLTIKAKSIDRVITSPPYLNAIDYMRASKYTLVWMGHTIPDLRAIRSASIGCEVGGTELPDDFVARIVTKMVAKKKLDTRQKKIIARYVRDLGAVIRQVARVLKDDGSALFVVGESTNAGILIRNSVAITQLAREHGLKVKSSSRRRLPPNRRYLPPPTSRKRRRELDKRMAYEVLLRLVRA